MLSTEKLSEIGVLYTTYLGKAKKIPKDAIQIIIMADPPFDVSKYPQYKWWPELAPTSVLKNDFKAGRIGWEYFKNIYQERLVGYRQAKRNTEIFSFLEEGKDVYIICCEKDNIHCHRKLYAEFLSSHMPIVWSEF